MKEQTDIIGMDEADWQSIKKQAQSSYKEAMISQMASRMMYKLAVANLKKLSDKVNTDNVKK